MTLDATTVADARGRDVGRWTRADWIAFALIFVCAAALQLPSLARPLTASHDGKSGLIVRQMVDDGRWFVDDLDVGKVNKPPLYYWLAAGVSLLAGGVSEWSVRLPSVLACALTAGLTFALGRELYGRRAGILAAAALATTVHFHLLAQATRLDAMVMPAVLGAMLGYYRSLASPAPARSRESFLWAAFGHAFITMGVLSKGPIVIVLTGLVMLGWLVARRVAHEGTLGDDLRRLHLPLGAAIVLVTSLPVYAAMERASHGRFLGYFLLRENLARAGVPVEDVREYRRHYSFFFYFGTIWLGAAPWSLFLPVGLVSAWRARALPTATRLLPMLYLALPFLFLSAVPYKKWAYLMTVYPPIALMAGKAWAEAWSGTLGTDRATRALLVAAAVALVVAAAGTALFAVGVLRPDALGTVAGPDGLIHAKKSLALPKELEAVKGRVLGAAVPLGAATLGLVLLAAMLWRRRTAQVMVVVLAMAIGGSLYNDFVIRPAESARLSLKPFAERVNAYAETSGGAPLVLCAGEAYELRYYLRADAEVIPVEKAEAFLARLAPGASAGEPVRVILPRMWVEQVEKRTGPLEVLLATGPDEAIGTPMALVAARRLGESEAPAGRAPSRP